MSLLTIEHLTQRFGEKILYEDASLRVNKGDHLGLTGQNGVGKSTLIKILTGEILADDGAIIWQNNLKIGYLDQYMEVIGESTISEFLHQAYQPLYAIEAKINELYSVYGETGEDKLLERAGTLQTQLDESDFYQIDPIINDLANGLGIEAIGLDRPMKELSGGQRSKVILAKLLLEEPDMLLLDEPTNYLDDTHIQWLISYLNNFTGTFILVSHDYHFLNAVTNCICDIEFGKLTKYTGNVEKSFAQKELNKESYLKQYHAQQAKIEKTEAYIRKYKAGNRATMAKSRQKQLDRLERLTPPGSLMTPQIAFPYQPIVASLALITDQLVIGYEKPLLAPIDLSVHSGEKVAIKGFNGIGKSTLIKTLTEKIKPLSGEFQYPANTKIAYFSQDLTWENDYLTPLAYLSDRFPKKTVKEIRTFLAKCGLPDKLVNQPLRLLSGGEQTKVKLCELTMDTSNLIFLDEPTNHIDAAAKESLREAIQEYPGTIIIVSHEEEFYADITDRIINIEEMIG
ncbi:ABC-F family ATP-binding cassette domain-containing protein [Enterococcus wangshanyuanii]|uniref:ABC transporter ATP-binding protein n=1 Tax=Enterococcus wangshanyuanii TaxID=2005703 RepID=A0ABQ1NYX3_9ENTE|nr:ABC-F family ATP-binding cassette domain-containing protein [Enterococcus wangshanyuanii]GGC87586.1 ABC transporter ATP-binding protein [Enterococcus wangshanyuanii]